MSQEPRILDAASVLLVDTTGTHPRLLMGLRQESNIFLPNKWVFPGGRLESTDAKIVARGTLDRGDVQALQRRLLPSTPSTSIATMLALAAVRELFEETGHALAVRTPGARHSAVPGWERFASADLEPDVARLQFLARAITPPGRPRRYDTRFFVADRAAAIEDAGQADGEFADVNWFTIEEAKALDLPNITRRILADLEELLPRLDRRNSIPFYYQEAGIYRRDLIERTFAVS